MSVVHLILAYLMLIVQLAVADSQVFNLIAVTTYDINSAIQLFPLAAVNGSLVLSREGGRLSFEIGDDGIASIQGTNEELIVSDNDLLTAGENGTSIFYIIGEHLHYNEDFVFVACPKDTNNDTFEVYATTNTGICSGALDFTLRPVTNTSQIISSYMPEVLGGTATKISLRTTSIQASSGATGSLTTTTASSMMLGSTVTATSHSETEDTDNDVVTETIYESTVESTDSSNNVVTETIIVENEQTLNSVKTTTAAGTTDQDDNVITITTEVSGSTSSDDDDNTIIYVTESTSSSSLSIATETIVTEVLTTSVCADSDCNTIYVSLLTTTEQTTEELETSQTTSEGLSTSNTFTTYTTGNSSYSGNRTTTSLNLASNFDFFSPFTLILLLISTLLV
ncbi:hypothetical protein DASC09_033440 [Saccharomycopsis crataegensis]|uniref:Uncharacterized protein n=1 Tax=Saccharomycopsis crataegensis TaxID=43959 RepID=A0AAV5QMY7_9ASCO|nr:hypothetical protein DASC09_033440 [Saccharomycopsis crataegensis]